MSLGLYLLGVAELIFVCVTLGFAAHRFTSRVLPEWEGAPARLVEVIFAIALATWIGQLLGTIGLFREVAYLAVCAAVAGAAGILTKPPGRSEPGAGVPKVPPLGLLITVAMIGLLFTHWGVEMRQALEGGIRNFDSLWYHMPFAVEMSQSGSTTEIVQTETVFLNWFYPQNSELLHAVGILLTERDFASLFVNLGWLAVTLLAAWCIGRPNGRGHLTVAAAAVVLECHTLVVREPGAAKNDVVAAALILAAVAILITWRSKRGEPSQVANASQQDEPSREPEASPTGERADWRWPLAFAGLAAGLAAGSKLTVLALVAGLTVVAVLIAPGGRRGAAAAWWGLPALAGGMYWYVRNLFLAGNPVPQVLQVGPLDLPGPERLQEARPDFNILHYATDTGVWTEYFGPGLRDAFGVLWPAVLAAALAGALLAVIRGNDRTVRMLGWVALLGMAAYLVTPLSAAGIEGEPEGFAINIRFLIPALLLGLVLLPLAPFFRSGSWQWALLAALFVATVVTNESIGVLRVQERVFGLGLSFALVGIPAALWLVRSRGANHRFVVAGFAVLAVGVIAAGHPVQRDYFKGRFAALGAYDLSDAYTWARDVQDSRIGLAGTTAGFLGYGFYGADLSNTVDYIGRESEGGGFDAIPTCSEFRRAVNGGDLDYLVTAPFLNFIDPSQPISSPEAGWLRGDRGVRRLQREGNVTVWSVEAALDPEGCGPANRPLRRVPDQPLG